jgi:hypothetical protein
MTDQYPDLTLDLDLGSDFNLMDTDSSVASQGLKPLSDDGDEDEIRFAPGTEEYRKARKRRQNRESAARNRARKKADYYTLEHDIEKLSKENRRLMLENQSLRTENEILKKELSFYVTVMEKTAKQGTSAAPGLLATTVLASVLCVCFVLGSGVESASAAGGRQLLSMGNSGFANVPRALGLAFVCLAVVWLTRIYPSTDTKPTSLV